jgi:hypothetical protein
MADVGANIGFLGLFDQSRLAVSCSPAKKPSPTNLAGTDIELLTRPPDGRAIEDYPTKLGNPSFFCNPRRTWPRRTWIVDMEHSRDAGLAGRANLRKDCDAFIRPAFPRDQDHRPSSSISKLISYRRPRAAQATTRDFAFPEAW